MEMQDPKMMMMMMITSREEAAVVDEEGEEEAEVALPGFRFHPTDEELVSFYLKRKIEKKPFSFEIIKQIDIYKHDPWDLARLGSVGDKEWYFYCKRGRKYKNSVRPNRVTGSGGFWKATGIDRPIYDSSVAAVVNGSAGLIVGLKKSLVYYRGSAGKGTKTDWMMHEFRLPSQPLSPGSSNSQLPEAEIWTLCRILKRSRKHTPDWKELSPKRVSFTTKNTSISAQSNNTKERYICFTNPSTTIQAQQRQHFDDHGIKHVRRQSEEKMIFERENIIDYSTSNANPSNYHDIKGQWASSLLDHQTNYASELASNFSSPLNTSSSVYDQDQVDDGNDWEDLSSVVEFAMRELYD